MISPLAQFSTDIRFALRQLRKSPGFAITAILTLSLGMASAAAIFSFVDSALIRPLPYPGLSQLMAVFETSPLGGQHSHYSWLNYVDLQRYNRVFASTAVWDNYTDFVLSGRSGVQRVHGTGVSGDFFRILGVTPVLGRDFDSGAATEDIQAFPSTVILSYAAWHTRFGGKSDVLGKTVLLNGEPYTVIGVLPRSFQFAPTGATEFWTTLHSLASDSCALHRGCMALGVIARLKEGVTLPQALGDVRSIAAHEAREHPDPDRNRSANVVPLSEAILGDIRPVLLVLLAGAGLLMLIAYVNVTGLLLVRSEHRQREFAVRGALGAGHGRLLRQLITEAFVMAAVSSALGLLAVTFVRDLMLGLILADMLEAMPYLRANAWNPHLTAFAAALVSVACTLFALTPALRLPFGDLRGALASGGRGSAGTVWRRMGGRLVVIELAVTMVLLAGAGLLGKSFYRLLHADFGFNPGHLATLRVLAPESKYSSYQQAIALQSQIVSRVRSLPGVTAAGTADELPVTSDGLTQIGFVGRPILGENNEAGHRTISPGYLPVLGARLLAGRDFNEDDQTGSPLVVIINQTLARRYFRGENPIGRQIFWHGRPQLRMQIVGVIADVKEDALDASPTSFVYTPFGQGTSPGFRVAVRTAQDPASVLPSLIAAIGKIDPSISVSDVATMPEMIEGSWAAYLHRASAWLAGGFAVLALLLSSVGLYGVVAWSVSQRTREIGIRMALGADRCSVYQLVLKEAGWLTLIGLVLALPGSLAAGVLLRSLLFGVRSWDLPILVAVAAVLVTSAMMASFIPARRAASVNPVEALRAE